MIKAVLRAILPYLLFYRRGRKNVESAFNLPPVRFINVGKRTILVPLDINLLATESAGPPVSSHPVVLYGWGGKKNNKKKNLYIWKYNTHAHNFSPFISIGFTFIKTMTKPERAGAPEHITTCCHCFAGWVEAQSSDPVFIFKDAARLIHAHSADLIFNREAVYACWLTWERQRWKERKRKRTLHTKIKPWFYKLC